MHHLKVARDPGDPTTKEREDHNATHIPFRSWCPVQKWKRKRDELQGHYFIRLQTFGQEDDCDDKATAFVYEDDHTKMIFGHVCERKGASDTWVIEKIKEDIARLGYQDVILKGDGEPALPEKHPP